MSPLRSLVRDADLLLAFAPHLRDVHFQTGAQHHEPLSVCQYVTLVCREWHTLLMPLLAGTAWPMQVPVSMPLSVHHRAWKPEDVVKYHFVLRIGKQMLLRVIGEEKVPPYQMLRFVHVCTAARRGVAHVLVIRTWQRPSPLPDEFGLLVAEVAYAPRDDGVHGLRCIVHNCKVEVVADTLRPDTCERFRYDGESFLLCAQTMRVQRCGHGGSGI